MIEKSADPVDQASIFEEAFTANSILDVQARLAAQTHPDFDGKTCLECGEDIPALRLSAGRIRCTSCEGLREEKGKQFRRLS